MSNYLIRFFLISAVLLLTTVRTNSQSALPEVFNTSSIDEQIKYLEERTRIYENYRAIREDMFMKINRNIRDTLSSQRIVISGLNSQLTDLESRYDSLNSILENTTANLHTMTATKNSIRLVGLEVDKVVYNSVTWIIIAALLAILSFGFLAFKRNMSVTRKTGKELRELRDEFEAYRQTTRIAREKMQMDHFNEIRKLKGK